MPISRCDQLEASLDAALRRFTRERASFRGRRETGRDLRYLFARLGFSFADLDALDLAPGGSDLGAALRDRASARLEAERRRLARLARSGSAVYDAGRHLAVRAALRWLEDASAEAGPAEPERRLSGSVLNNRFRRLHPRRAPRAAPAATLSA